MRFKLRDRVKYKITDNLGTIVGVAEYTYTGPMVEVRWDAEDGRTGTVDNPLGTMWLSEEVFDPTDQPEPPRG